MGRYNRPKRRAVKEVLMEHQCEDMLDFIQNGHQLADMLVEGIYTDLLCKNIDDWMRYACTMLEDYWRKDND